MENNANQQKKDHEYFKVLIRGFIVFFIVIVIIFVVAGRIDYWQGWVFFALVIIRIVVGFKITPDKADLVKERTKPGPGRKQWDKIVTAFFIPFSIAILILAPLDAGRFHWTKPLSIGVYIVSCLVFVLSLIIGMWAVHVNKFFSSVVRIQTDRGHKVVENGPYHYIRHPGYAGMVLMFLSMSLVLGSVWALIPAGANVIVLIIRTYLEDITLQKELTGYREYSLIVKYRLIPRIW
jgi:protein-S-isoprenylcysteine O-methyltransferase Ste14